MFDKLRYADIKTCDVVNGVGLRVSLYVTGCCHGCKGCFNANLMNPKAGRLFEMEDMEYLLHSLDNRHIKGLSLLGGDPLFPRNLFGVNRIVETVREELPEKDIWLWTGYKLSDLSLSQMSVVEKVDVLIDGKYEEGNKTRKLWRGSDNQCLYQIKDRIPVKVD